VTTLATLHENKPKVNLCRYRDPNTSERLLSAEIEFCGFENSASKNLSVLNNVLRDWYSRAVHDGTLPSTGIEINTHPASGKYWRALVTDIMNASALCLAWVDSQAGCHIHVDCRDLDYSQLARVMRLCGCLEPALYSIIPVSRTTHHYCQFWALNYSMAIARVKISEGISSRSLEVLYRNKLLTLLYGYHSREKVSQVKTYKRHENRYRGINLHSYTHRGTLEFRMPPGTVYAINIINWGSLLSNLISYAASSTMDQIAKDCYTIEGDLHDTCLNDWSSLHNTAKDSSFKLLCKLAPSPEICDWLIERRKWALSFQNKNFAEQIIGES
jgi:hypothetical protein